MINNPFVPQSFVEIGVTFCVFTCETRFNPYFLDYKPDIISLMNSGFVADKKTKIFTHGYKAFYSETNWMGVNVY